MTIITTTNLVVHATGDIACDCSTDSSYGHFVIRAGDGSEFLVDADRYGNVARVPDLPDASVCNSTENGDTHGC